MYRHGRLKRRAERLCAGLSSHGAERYALAETGVRDFADVLGISTASHAPNKMCRSHLPALLRIVRA